MRGIEIEFGLRSPCLQRLGLPILYSLVNTSHARVYKLLSNCTRTCILFYSSKQSANCFPLHPAQPDLNSSNQTRPAHPFDQMQHWPSKSVGISSLALLILQPITMRRSLLHDQSHSPDSKQQFKRYSFYIFVDRHLGPGSGKQFLNLETEQICLQLDEDSDRHSSQEKKLKYDIHVFFYDVYDSKRIEIAMKNLKSTAEAKQRKVRIIICGDQSTLDTVLSLAENNQVSTENIPIGILPSGQYNDLSSVLGWGQVSNQDLVGQDLKHLKSYVKKWTNAVIQKIDLWRVEIQACQDGEIEAVDRVNQRKIVLTQRTHQQLMISHMNIGVHARIGLGFDLQKGQSSIGNKFIHAYESFKKLMCMSTAKTDKMVSTVQIRVDNEKGDKQVYRTLFSARNPAEQHSQNGVKYLDSSASLVCMNIDTYQGIHQVWKHSTSEQDESPRNSYSTQSYHDSKLELVTFSSTVGTSSQKLCQTEGSIQMRMQKHQPAYVQIDNSSYKITHPRAIRISKHGRIQVLINKQSLMSL